MKKLVLSILLLAAGCYMPAGSTPAPPKAEQTSNAVVFEQLAVAVERGDYNDSTNRFCKVAARTLKAHGITPPAGYDDALMPWLKKNWEPSEADCSDMAKRLRSLK